jgi:hypothetical protein
MARASEILSRVAPPLGTSGDLDHSLDFERLQRLADGEFADPEYFGEIALARKLVPRPVLARDDPPFDVFDEKIGPLSEFDWIGRFPGHDVLIIDYHIYYDK